MLMEISSIYKAGPYIAEFIKLFSRIKCKTLSLEIVYKLWGLLNVSMGPSSKPCY